MAEQVGSIRIRVPTDAVGHYASWRTEPIAPGRIPPRVRQGCD